MKIKILVCTFLGLLFLAMGCKKEDEITVKPKIILKNGADYSTNEQLVPVGGKLKFGITASDGGAIVTNLRIQRIADGNLITELDKGLYIKNGGLDFEYSANKSSANQEIWQFFVMNSNRDSASTTLKINLGAGSAYGEIYHYPSIKVGMQSNTEYPNYLDLHTGALYSRTNVSGHEADIDLVGFFYITSDKKSPTLCCPGYTGSSAITAVDRYPEIEPWSIKKLTQYDYFSSDNDLVNADKFEHAQNDSLLIASYLPESVSGLCKYCNTGKIIPFRTEDGKYGLVRVLHADLTTNGYMELDIKIQK